ncbi:hypothetical protein Ahy_A07g037130 isoform B [Arachis hypogaea]|uniref:Cation efflux protein cytoplasmic domain-containing protein n=1 Tax=Arachis hypogaea TaxID=3818 RepID=A0A445CHV7_ARAHY|nr:hypothetical protein Ahy_A07g037130 isoform B [Arachis hypogaea]
MHGVVALIGVGGSILGVKFLDPLAGLLYLGIGGCCNPSEHLNPIKPRILQVDGFKGCHRLRGRRAGSYLYLDVHIEVCSPQSLLVLHITLVKMSENEFTSSIQLWLKSSYT